MLAKADGKTTQIGPPHNDVGGWVARLQDAFGARGTDFPTWLCNSLVVLTRNSAGGCDEIRLNAMIAAIQGAAPENEIQSMLATQMCITHEMAATVLIRAQKVDTLSQYESAGSMAVKLLRTFVLQAEALAKLQRGGEQVVKVVHVHPGGQAIVGNVMAGAPNGTGGGATIENANQPHAKAELPAPGASPMSQMRFSDPAGASMRRASSKR